MKVVDALERSVDVRGRPRRIVSLVPSLTEALFAFGLEEEIVGVTRFCVEPREGVLSKAKVGGTKTPDLPRLIELEPDLVIANAEENRKEDIEALIALVDPPPAVILAPDRRRGGTNALLAFPPALIEYAFGPTSFDRHRAEALAAGVRLAICDRPGLALDLDLPEDLGLFRQVSGGKAA